MKITLVVILIFSGFSSTWAQIKKGTFLLGAGFQVSGTVSRSTSSNTNYLEGSLHMPVGFFVRDNLLIGFTPLVGKNFHSRNSSLPHEDLNTKNYLLGIAAYMTKFYTLNEKWYFSVQGSFGYNISYSEVAGIPNVSTEDFETNRLNEIIKTYQVSMSPGINYLINPNTLISLQAEILSIAYNRRFYSNNYYKYQYSYMNYSIVGATKGMLSLKFLIN